MKKISFMICALMLAASTALFAQENPFSAGTVEFGIGNLLSYDRIWDDDFTYNNFSIGTFGNGTRPAWEMSIYPCPPVFNVGYFIIDGLAIDLQGGFYRVEEEDSDPGDIWFVAPRLKYYLVLSEALFLDLHAGIQYTNFENESNEYEQLSYLAGAGIGYLLTENFAVCLGLDYALFEDYKKNGDEYKDSGYNLLTASLGFKAFVDFSD